MKSENCEYCAAARVVRLLLFAPLLSIAAGGCLHDFVKPWSSDVAAFLFYLGISGAGITLWMFIEAVKRLEKIRESHQHEQ